MLQPFVSLAPMVIGRAYQAGVCLSIILTECNGFMTILICSTWQGLSWASSRHLKKLVKGIYQICAGFAWRKVKFPLLLGPIGAVAKWFNLFYVTLPFTELCIKENLSDSIWCDSWITCGTTVMATGHTPTKTANQSPARAVNQSLEETVKVSDVGAFLFTKDVLS